MSPFRLHQPARRFSRAWWFELFRNFSWVAMITMLIWIYADMEFTDEAKLSGTLVLTTGQSQKVMLLSPDEHRISFTLRGSQTALEQVQREFASGGKILRCDIAGEYDPGVVDEKNISTAKLISQSARLAERGVVVDNVQPEFLAVKLRGMRKLSGVPVELNVTGGELLALPTPKKVDIFVPAEVYEKLQGQPQSLKLQTQPIDLSEYTPGQPHQITAEIVRTIRVGDEKISIEPSPSIVSYAIELKSRTEIRELLIDVKVMTPASWTEASDTTWRDYQLVREAVGDWRPRLQISGPKKDLVVENVTAYVTLTENDKTPVESWLKREIKVRFKPGTNLKLVGSAPTVKYRLEKRKSTTMMP